MNRNGLAALAALAAVTAASVTACVPGERLDGTRWLAEFIDERGVIDDAQTTLEFTEPGRAAGRGGCNRYSAPVDVDGSRIHFGEPVSTKMACINALMDQENRFMVALRGTHSFRVQDQKLQLLDSTGKVRASLSPLDPKS